MAVHPVAIQLEELIDKAKRVRDAVRRAKKAGARVAIDNGTRRMRILGTLRNPLAGSGDFQNLATADNPEDQAFYRERLSRLGPVQGGDKQLARLRKILEIERQKCATQYIRANAAYRRCRIKGGTRESCKGLAVAVPCPGAKAALDALVAYQRSSKSVSSVGGSNSGGGGGGGF